MVVEQLAPVTNAKAIAQKAANTIDLARAVLSAVPTAQRVKVLDELNRREGIRILPGVPGERTNIAPNQRFLLLLVPEVRDLLGPNTQVGPGLQEIPGWWVSFEFEGHPYWMVIPRHKVGQPVALEWIWWSAVSAVIVLIGTWLITWRINRPLAALASATSKIGKANHVDLAVEHGPLELRNLIRSFNQMATDLAAMQKERTIMLAGISHDLRTPLTRLRLAIEILEKRIGAAEHVAILQDIEEMDAIVGQFLAFAHETAANQLEVVALNELIKTSCEQYARSGKSITLDLDTLPPVTGSSLALKRLLANLIDNAYYHGSKDVAVQTQRIGNQIVLSVLDRGPGIPSTQVDKALQPFSRLDIARGGHARAGLGLAIAERIAKFHDGRIELLPRDGGGLEARVTIPARTFS